MLVVVDSLVFFVRHLLADLCAPPFAIAERPLVGSLRADGGDGDLLCEILAAANRALGSWRFGQYQFLELMPALGT